ncbi:hypothetical protein Hanom_Chr10g00944381 [Helianthus anomalus]
MNGAYSVIRELLRCCHCKAFIFFVFFTSFSSPDRIFTGPWFSFHLLCSF